MMKRPKVSIVDVLEWPMRAYGNVWAERFKFDTSTDGKDFRFVVKFPDGQIEILPKYATVTHVQAAIEKYDEEPSTDKST
jgi:hypothetical protein